MTKREKALAEMLRYVPNHYFEAAFKACSAFERAVRDEETQDAIDAVLKLYRGDPKGWCSPDHPCRHWKQVDCVTSAIRARIAARAK